MARGTVAKGESKSISFKHRYLVFAATYVANGLNATQAAITVGYAPKAAASQGSRLLRNAKVRAEVDRLKQIAADRCEVSVENTVRRLADIGYRPVENVTAGEAVSALDKLMRFHGGYAKDHDQDRLPVAPIAVQVILIGPK